MTNPLDKNNEKKELEKELDTFFSSGDDMNMKKLDRKKRSGAVIPLFILLLLIGTLGFFSYLGYRFFSKEDLLQEQSGLLLSFSAAQNYPLATPTELVLDIVNNDGDLPEVSVLLEYPQDVKVMDSIPKSENTQHTLWKFSDVKRGAKLRISFTILIQKGSFQEKTLRATALYKQKGISSSFSAIATTALKTSQPLELFSLDGPQKIQPEQKRDYTIRIKDISAIQTDQTALLVHIPQTFVVSSVIPKADIGEFGWSKELLQKNQNLFTKEVVVVISGSYKEGTRGIQDVRMKFSQGEKLQQIVLQEGSFATNVSSQNLALTIRSIDSDSKKTVSYGDSTKFVIHYENESDEPMSNVELSFDARGPVDWKKSTADPVPLQKDSSLSWTSKEFERLALVQPQGHGDFLVTLTLLSPNAVRAQMSNPESPFEISELFEVQAHARFKKGIAHDDTVPFSEVNSQPTIVSLNSDLSLTTRIDRINDQTARITLVVQNSLHDVEALRLQGTLPLQVEWKDSFQLSAGTIAYHADTRAVEWSLNKLPRSVSSLEIWFDIDHSHTSGKELFSKPTLEAQDMTTGGMLSHIYDSVILSE